jgi:nucleoid-associated protein YejK
MSDKIYINEDKVFLKELQSSLENAEIINQSDNSEYFNIINEEKFLVFIKNRISYGLENDTPELTSNLRNLNFVIEKWEMPEYEFEYNQFYLTRLSL